MSSATHSHVLEENAQQKDVGWRTVMMLCLCNCGHFYSVCSLFSYAGIMTADLGWAIDRDHAGNIAGALQSANVLGRIPTSSLWGVFVARYGLKRSLEVSMCSVCIGCALFAFSTDPIVAILVRLVFLGIFNGWPAIFGPLVVEIAGTPDRQMEITGKVFSSGSVMQLIGPAIGGWSYGVLPGFPASVPSLIGSGICLAALLSLQYWFPDTAGPRTNTSVTFELELDEHSGIPTQHKVSHTGSGQDDLKQKPSLREAVLNWPMPLMIGLRALQGYVCFSFFELVPLWAISSKRLGGIAVSENMLGVVLASSAIISSVFSAAVMSRITSCLGHRSACIVANVIAAIAFVYIPYTTTAEMLILLHTICNSFINLLGASYLITTNNTAPESHRSVINGICVSFEALGKGVGPISISVSFAWTLSRFGYAGHGFVFFALGALHMILLLGTALLPKAQEAVENASRPAAIPEPSLLGSKTIGSKRHGQKKFKRLQEDLNEDGSDQEANIEQQSEDESDGI